jgi:hypothetical protein
MFGSPVVQTAARLSWLIGDKAVVRAATCDWDPQEDFREVLAGISDAADIPFWDESLLHRIGVADVWGRLVDHATRTRSSSLTPGRARFLPLLDQDPRNRGRVYLLTTAALGGGPVTSIGSWLRKLKLLVPQDPSSWTTLLKAIELDNAFVVPRAFYSPMGPTPGDQRLVSEGTDKNDLDALAAYWFTSTGNAYRGLNAAFRAVRARKVG